MPQDTVKVHNAHNNMDETYTGVSLERCAGKGRICRGQDESAEDDPQLRRAEGTDKYWVIYSAIEVEPSEHDGGVIMCDFNGR